MISCLTPERGEAWIFAWLYQSELGISEASTLAKVILMLANRKEVPGSFISEWFKT